MEKIQSSRMQPIRDVAYQSIRKAILRKDFAPGERLTEEQLAETLGISRTPVREALRKLEAEKMVSHHPNKGVVVTEIKTYEMGDLYEIRTLIETIIARRAALNAKPEDIERLYSWLDKELVATDPVEISDCIAQYNYTISEIANCPLISDLLRQVRETMIRMILSGHMKPERRPDVQKEHREIVAAIAAGDCELVQKLTIQHLKNASFAANT